MFFMNFGSLVLSVDRLNIPHEAGSVSSSFWLILAAERKIIRLGEWLLARTVLVHE